jgi:hypothetical protein
MASLEKIDRISWQPIPLAGMGTTEEKIADFTGKTPGISIVDQYSEQLEEVFLLRNPKYRFDKNYQAEFENFKNEHGGNKPLIESGTWFYYPWLNALIHFLPEDMHYEVRTSRNRYLINGEEQKKYYHATVGVLGMSVGSHVALTIALTGGGKNFKLADSDSISASNMNRIRTGFQNVGLPKVISVARQIFEMNPYSAITIYPEGATEENLNDIITNPILDVLIEETDNPYFKIKAREYARAAGVPVLMAADNGDGNIADIERYDLDKNYPILHGIMGNVNAEQFKMITPHDLPSVIAKMAGANRAVPRMLQSVPEVGKTIYSWPQLGTAANLCGTTLAYLARRVILKAPNIQSGRYEVNLDAIFENDYNERINERKEEFESFLKKMQRE